MAIRAPERVLGLVFKAALAVIVTTYAYNAAAPVIARMRRKRELKKELRSIEKELEFDRLEKRVHEFNDRSDELFAAMDKARMAVGLKPAGGGN